MHEPALSSAGSEPAWITDSLRNAQAELRFFLHTLWAVLRGPKRFGEDWGRGELHALNPLAFLFTSVGVTGPYRAFWARLFNVTGASGIWIELLKPLEPILSLALVAAVAHAVFRWAGSDRRLPATVGISFYMGAGPGALLGLISAPFGMAQNAHRLPVTVVMIYSVSELVLLIVYLAAFARALQGLHRLRWWWMAFAVTVSFGLMMLPLGWLRAHHPNVFLALLT